MTQSPPPRDRAPPEDASRADGGTEGKSLVTPWRLVCGQVDIETWSHPLLPDPSQILQKN